MVGFFCWSRFKFRLRYGAFLFWVVLGSEGGCFFGFLAIFKGLSSNKGGGSFLLVDSLGLGWLVLG